MTGQSRKSSLVEQLYNQGIGFLISWPINCVLLPLIPKDGGAAPAAAVTLVFMAVSIARGYFVRRVFNRKTVKQNQ